jgi:hypothetical protein
MEHRESKLRQDPLLFVIDGGQAARVKAKA